MSAGFSTVRSKALSVCSKGKFAKKPAIYEANAKVIEAGYDYGNNIHASVSTYRIETEEAVPGVYTDINGNTATAWGFIMASEKSGRPLFLGSYPITPATDILQELAKRKDLGVKALQMEDEIAGVCSAIGASFAGHLAVTSTSGPGLALKSEGIGLAVIAELPLVIDRRAARRSLHRSAHQDRTDRPHAGSLRPQRRVASGCSGPASTRPTASLWRSRPRA